MTLREEMLRAARRAPRLLGDEACQRLADFLTGLRHDDGGFRGRSAESDLYYTVFALDALYALGVALAQPQFESYLGRFGDGENLDFVHQACLARAWTHGDGDAPGGLAGRIRAYRSADGGFAPEPEADRGTVYAAFLAAGALEDLGTEVEQPDKLMQSIKALRTDGGAYANERGQTVGLTPATAAAATLRLHYGHAVAKGTLDWLLAQSGREGGFRAATQAPIPDLMSTATALHALGLAGAPLDAVREPCLDFLDRLWRPTGGFCAHAADETLDCEYAFYGLLAVGHLCE